MATGRRTRSKGDLPLKASPNSAKMAPRKSAEKPGAASSGGSSGSLSGDDRKQRVERELLQTFRRFLMSPGQMLCFAGPDLAHYRDALARLTDRGLLVAESFPGGYSLTHAGFNVMRVEEAAS